jgi:hypothetical protein
MRARNAIFNIRQRYEYELDLRGQQRRNDRFVHYRRQDQWRM